MDEEWITTKQAAEATGFNLPYLRRHLRTQKLVGRKFGSVWQVNSSSLTEYCKPKFRFLERRPDRRRGSRTPSAAQSGAGAGDEEARLAPQAHIQLPPELASLLQTTWLRQATRRNKTTECN